MRRRRNPIEVHAKGKVGTSFMGGMALEKADHYEIVVTRDGIVAGKVHLYDDEDGLSVELIETSKDQRNKHAVVLPLLHASFKFAKSIKAPTISTQVTWQGIFRVAVRFKKPSMAVGNYVLKRSAEKKGLSGYWTPSTFIVRPEDLPDEALYANYSDPSTARTAPLYEGTDGIGLRKGSFFNTGEDIFQRVSSSDTEDEGNKIRKVQNLFLDYDFKKARNDRSLIKQCKVTTLEDLGSLLSKKTPMDSKKLNFDKLPMLTLMWDL